MPAKFFNSKERGRCKSHYSRRNLVWTIIKDLALAGVDVDVTIDRIYAAYGHNKSVTDIINKSVTDIINKMSKQRREAGGKNAPGESWKHPNLRVGA